MEQNRESRSISGHLLYDKGYSEDKQGTDDLFKNGAWSTGYANRKSFNVVPYSHIIYKIINSMDIVALSVKGKTVKFLKNKTGEYY